ncbi:MAG TPA: RluA family pseudouridine synthase [Kiritimatiellae bacterium]|nr:RluA family pseudouridine synthase [Kiritimatiellia bacterium]
MVPDEATLKLRVPASDAGLRLDVWLAKADRRFSRSRWQRLIRGNHVRVEGRTQTPHYLVRGGEVVSVRLPPAETAGALTPCPIPLDIVYEDADLIAVNKPPGLVVHPAPGHSDDTLVNAVLYHCPDLDFPGDALRPGIVHRLDKDTSGIILVAKNERSLYSLALQFRTRRIRKTYLALVRGVPSPAKGVIRAPIGRHPRDRKRMSTRSRRGRRAETCYTVLEDFHIAALLEIGLVTGRTHQIRVHLAWRGHPVLGDRQYGGRRVPETDIQAQRQMLHSFRIRFEHPKGGEMTLEAPVTGDMRQLLDRLRSLEGRG